MEKEHVESSDANSGKHEARGKRRRPNVIGSVAIEPETAERSSRGLRHAVEARWLHATPPPEHIGHMLMSAETKPTAAAEKSGPERSGAADLSASLHGQRVETLNRAELMSLSERIMIDGSSLHQIYETHLIGERGLRRLIAEYLHDGDLKQALRSEVVERERDFERDPVMRDMTPDQTPPIKTASQTKTALDELLERAEIGSGDRSEEAAFFKARARYEARALHQHKQHRRLIDVGLAAAIVVLLLLVIMLSMSRL